MNHADSGPPGQRFYKFKTVILVRVNRVGLWALPGLWLYRSMIGIIPSGSIHYHSWVFQVNWGIN